MKRTFISAAAILAFTAAGHADELSDIQAQAKQLRDQNAAMTKRLADLEKRQKSLEAKPAVATINPVDAMAADLPYKAAVKAKAAESDDICWHGVCLYGNFDMGVNYQTHGTSNDTTQGGLSANTIVNKSSNGGHFDALSNQFSTSFIGLRGKQEVADNLYAVFNLQTLFNLNDGANANGLGSIAQNNGLSGNILAQSAFGDSSKAGVMFNNAAYFGLSSPTYGTLTMGRQSALSSDLIVNYDSLSGSNSWSLITFAGANGGGGATENRIYDNSFEYRVNVGPVRFAVETQVRNGPQSATGNAFEGNIGFDYMGLSMDFLGGKVFDATTAAPLSGAALSAANTTAPVSQTNGLLGLTVSDNTVFQAAARYTIGPWKLFGGYENIHSNNPNNPLAPGAFIQGGFNAASANNAAFNSTRVLQTAWVGVRYAITPALDITGAWYHEWQNGFLNAATAGANIQNTIIGGCSVAVASQSGGCPGQEDVVSLVVDWRFARHMDFYAGIAWSQVQGGLANGFIQANATALNGQ
ncbi:MAG TPA: porin, partial [Bradyrhizobium sp.]|nr:porin [Bradyrhizobium sp.]